MKVICEKMIELLALILIPLIGYTVYMTKYLSLSGLRIAMIIGALFIGFPFLGVLGGFACDLLIAYHATEWFPIIWMIGGAFGGIVGVVGCIVLCVVIILRANISKHRSLDLNNHPTVIFDADGIEKQVIFNDHKVTFVQGWKDYFHNAINFKGRTDFRTFIWGVMSYIIVNMIFGLSTFLLFFLIMAKFNVGLLNECEHGHVIMLLILLLLTIPLVALNVRRFRDIGMKDGLNYTLNIIYLVLILIPIVGVLYGIILFIFLCKPTSMSQRRDSK